MASDRLASVDALRGIAAFSVVLCHYVGSSGFVPEGWLQQYALYGRYGVHVFFVISGFVIPYALYRQKFDLRRDGLTFIIRRLIRLEPPYLIVAALSTLLLYVSQQMPWYHGPTREHLLFDLALHPFYLVPWFGGQWSNLVFWSLAIEFQYYFLALAIAPLILSHRHLIQRGGLALMFILALASKDDRLVFIYLPLFGFGFVGFLYIRRAMPPLEAFAWLTVYAVLCNNIPDGRIVAVVGLLTIVAIVFTNITARPLLALGTISYSLYLVHVPIGVRIMNGANRIDAHNTAFEAFVIAAGILLSILAAYTLWRWIEYPSIAASRRWGNASRPHHG